jgi:Ubiquitin interaction motif
MDVLSSDLYADVHDSDDILPDLATAMGLKKPLNRTHNAQSTIQQTQRSSREGPTRIPSASQETLTRIDRLAEPNGSDALRRIKQMYLDQSMSQQPQKQMNPTSNGNVTRSAIQIDLDPISSSPPLPPFAAVNAPVNRVRSFNAAGTITSRSPLTTTVARTPLHRATTFPSALPARPIQETSRVNIYHEISDDDDEDLRAAIAASLANTSPRQTATFPSVLPAGPVQETSNLNIYHEISDDEDLRAAVAASLTDIESKPSARPPSRELSLFECPDDFFRSSPPPSQVFVRPTAPPSSQMSSKYSEPSSSASSVRVRDDTKRLLAALDDLTTNVLKRKNEDVPTQTKKKSVKKIDLENVEATKPKRRGALTQSVKVHQIRLL